MRGRGYNMKKQPEVTAQTRKRLMDAFWELYKENRIEKISVGAITKLSGLNRGTFYEYFTDIYDLLGQLEDEIIGTVMERLEEDMDAAGIHRELPPEEAFNAYPEGSCVLRPISYVTMEKLTKSCARIFSSYNDKIYVLINRDGDPAFQMKMRERLRDHVLSILHAEDEENLEYLVTFILSAFNGILGCWYESGKRMEPEALLNMMQILLCTGLFGYLGKDGDEYTDLIKDMIERRKA